MLHTQRLLIRRFTAQDGEALYAYLSDPKVVAYEPYDPATREEAFAEAARRAGDDHFYAVCLAETGELIGNIYFAPEDNGVAEIGYVFNSAYQHKGYACEAARAVIAHGFANMGIRRVIAMCNPENAPSWKLMERLGMRREARFIENNHFDKDVDPDGTIHWHDTYQYGLLAREFTPEA